MQWLMLNINQDFEFTKDIPYRALVDVYCEYFGEY